MAGGRSEKQRGNKLDQQLRDLRLAKRLVATGQARLVREASGVSRADLARGQPFTVGAVRLWEKGARSPRGGKGTAYGAVLRELMRPLG
jgi:DNA-binding transcriptional regulator YiaG